MCEFLTTSLAEFNVQFYFVKPNYFPTNSNTGKTTDSGMSNIVIF